MPETYHDAISIPVIREFRRFTGCDYLTVRHVLHEAWYRRTVDGWPSDATLARRMIAMQ